MALVSTWAPSGESFIPVTVSVWPGISVNTEFFLVSQILRSLSIPAVIT